MGVNTKRLAPPPGSQGEARQGRRETASSNPAPAGLGPGWWYVDAAGNVAAPEGETLADLMEAQRRGVRAAGLRVVGRGAG